MFALDELQYYPVNWKDGMRVTAKDFAMTDSAWTDALRDVRASLFQGLQFGLLPALRDNSDTSSYPKMLYEPSRFLLTLQECRAITEGGCRIEITEDGHRQLQTPLQLPNVKMQKQENASVYISVDIFSPQNAGKLTVDAPPRHQFVCPKYELSVIFESEDTGLSGFNHLKIAEYKWARNKFERDENFIPACMTIATHPVLMERFSRAGSYMKTIHDNSVALVRQYRSDSRPDVRDATQWIEKIATFIAQSLWGYNDLLLNQTPLNTVVFFKNFAQFILSTAEMQEVNMFLKEGAKSQRNMLKDVADPNFNGDDLRTAFNRIDIALRSMHLWLKSLAESFKQGRVIKVEEMK